MQNLKTRLRWYASAGGLISAGLLLIWLPSAFTHSGQHPNEAVNSVLPDDSPDAEHQTEWKCISAAGCTNENGDKVFPYNKLKTQECPGNDNCGHTVAAFKRATGYGGNWQYAGHRNNYKTEWKGYPPGWKNPLTKWLYALEGEGGLVRQGG